MNFKLDVAWATIKYLFGLRQTCGDKKKMSEGEGVVFLFVEAISSSRGYYMILTCHPFK